MLDKIIKELEIHIKACNVGMDKDCHPNDEAAYLNKIQAFREAIKIVEGYRHLTSRKSRAAGTVQKCTCSDTNNICLRHGGWKYIPPSLSRGIGI